MKIHYARIGEGLKRVPYHIMDAAIAGEHLVLRATELGIGTCWIGWFSARRLKRILGIPGSVKVVALIAAGFPREGEAPRPKKRIDMENLLFRETWPRTP
jgi:nitroreductase